VVLGYTLRGFNWTVADMHQQCEPAQQQSHAGPSSVACLTEPLQAIGYHRQEVSTGIARVLTLLRVRKCCAVLKSAEGRRKDTLGTLRGVRVVR
jgi:hypothetical protein